MPKKTAPKKYTWANTSPSFKTWFNKYYPGIDYDTLYSEDKFLVRKKFDKNLTPVNGHLTVTEVQRDAIRKTTEGFSDFSKKYGGDIAKLKSALQSNPDRFYDALKKAGINVYMVGDQYRFANTGPTNINKFKSAFEIKLKYSVAQLNKAAQTKHNLNFKQLTDCQQDNIRAQLSQGVKIKKRTVFTPLPKGSQIKVLQEFPDANSEHIPNTYGVLVRPSEGIPKGLKIFDTIIAINNVHTNDSLSFSDEINKYTIGDIVTLTIIRKKRFRRVDVPLKVLPVNIEAMYPRK